MEKKTFITFLGVLVLTFLATTAIKTYRAPVKSDTGLENLPLAKGDWIGKHEIISAPVMELLNPDMVFSATYFNLQGARVHLFVDYYAPDNTSGAIHSPRNCLPGSGWVIVASNPRTIMVDGRTISANRFHLSLGESRQIMDFWYVTRLGETANDYRLKFYTMISSLALRPTDKAFIRFVAQDSPESISAMEDFELLFISEIYGRLPF